MSKSVSYFDDQLVHLVKQGNHHAFSELYNRYNHVLYAYALKITGDHDQAQEIVQQVFVSFWNNRATIDIRGSVSRYLYTAIKYRFYRLIHDDKIHSRVQAEWFKAAEDTAPALDEKVITKETMKVIESIAAKLPGNMGSIFIMSKLGQLSNQEIAETLALSEKTVRNQLSLAKKKMIVWFNRSSKTFFIFFI